MSRYTGTVSDSGHDARTTKTTSTRARSKRYITIELDEFGPKVGTKVAIRVIMTDEEIGKKFREMFSDVERAGIDDLAEILEDSAGWAALADLVRDVAL